MLDGIEHSHLIRVSVHASRQAIYSGNCMPFSNKGPGWIYWSPPPLILWSIFLPGYEIGTVSSILLLSRALHNCQFISTRLIPLLWHRILDYIFFVTSAPEVYICRFSSFIIEKPECAFMECWFQASGRLEATWYSLTPAAPIPLPFLSIQHWACQALPVFALRNVFACMERPWLLHLELSGVVESWTGMLVMIFVLQNIVTLFDVLDCPEASVCK